MDRETVEKANSLCKCIDQTESSLVNVITWINDAENKKKKNDRNFGGNVYKLNICEYNDGSGHHIDMCGYHDNIEFLLMTKKFLEDRLNKYTKMLADL